jgi:EpsI family protein
VSAVLRWAPASLLSMGAVVTVALGPQQFMPLRAPLADAVPQVLAGTPGVAVEVTEAEARVAGFDSYLLRSHGAGDFSIYVGYYGSQTKGHTIHSPKNCLPGSGWEPLASTVQQVTLADGRTVSVNRYLLQKGSSQALVLYWYQGRGRVEQNEYRVKWDLLRDSALQRRSDEALVRIVVPVHDSEQAAAQRALEVANELIPAVDRAIPL